MILAVDVHYQKAAAKAVGVLFENWNDSEPAQIISSALDNISEYEPGSFYKRELPCILELLKLVDLNKIKTVVIDGYVYLDDDKKPGLGHYLYKSLNEKIPVIGVAKTSFAGNKKYVKEIYRGQSKTPLFVTAAGIDLQETADNISKMHGGFRIPTLLKLLDINTKI